MCVVTMLTALVRKSNCSLSIEQRAKGAYLGMAVGDALGATVEFMTPREIHAKHGIHNKMVGGGWLNVKPGQVTDDTTMALALGRAILAEGKVSADSAAIAFDEWMRSKPIDIGNTVRRGIVKYRKTGSSSVPYSEYDAGNGACMRVLPVALASYYLNRKDIAEACCAQSHVTHNNELSDAATECVVHMIHDAFGGATMLDLLKNHAQPLVKSQPLFKFRGLRVSNPSGYIVHTIQAVFQALFDTETFEDCLVDVVNRGGDADTTGAIAGMIAGAVYGVGEIPRHWLRGLDRKVRKECEFQAVNIIHQSITNNKVTTI